MKTETQYTEYSQIKGKKFKVHERLNPQFDTNEAASACSCSSSCLSEITYTVGELNDGKVLIEWNLDGNDHQTDYPLESVLIDINTNLWVLQETI